MEEVTEKRKKINIKAIIAIIICAAIIIGLVSIDIVNRNKETNLTSVAMGTVINMKIIAKNGEKSANIIKKSLDETENSLLSWRATSSDVRRINVKSGMAVFVSGDTVDIISKSLEISSNCGGAFDITIGKITQLWDFGGEHQRLPSPGEINTYLPYVGYKNVTISGNTVAIGKNQNLDLGAVGKGAACDRIKTALDETQTTAAVISVGGSLLLYGKRSFTIGIVNPEDDSKYMGTLKLSNTCVSTSGSYEKTFSINGLTYHHILDARTGYSAKSDLTSVTVVNSSGLVSDALSTACFILGYDDSVKLLKKYDAQAIFIYKDKSVKYTDGLKHSFELTDSSFKVSE